MANYLHTTIDRIDADGDQQEIDVVINFAVTSYTAGCKAQTYGDPASCWPAEGAEYTFEIESIEHDPVVTTLAPLTDAEKATLTAWFEAHHDKACERADENTADDYYDRADYLYDKWKDEQMERKS